MDARTARRKVSAWLVQEVGNLLVGGNRAMLRVSIQCGACQEACEKVFVVDGGEPAAIAEKYQAGSSATGEVGDGLAGCVNDAVDACPVGVISID